VTAVPPAKVDTRLQGQTGGERGVAKHHPGNEEKNEGQRYHLPRSVFVNVISDEFHAVVVYDCDRLKGCSWG